MTSSSGKKELDFDLNLQPDEDDSLKAKHNFDLNVPPDEDAKLNVPYKFDLNLAPDNDLVSDFDGCIRSEMKKRPPEDGGHPCFTGPISSPIARSLFVLYFPRLKGYFDGLRL